jgi:hypothetical protein
MAVQQSADFIIWSPPLSGAHPRRRPDYEGLATCDLRK